MSTFKLPDLGEGLSEAEIIAWHVQPGDRVVVDQPMVSVETAKAVVEVPVPFAGTVTALHGAVGDIIATGAPLIDFDSGIDRDSGTVVGSMPVGEAQWHESDAIDRPDRPSQILPRTRALPVARALAKHLGVDLAGVTATGRDGVVTLDDVLAQARVIAPPAGAAPSAAITPPPGAQPVPLRGARRAMAHSMSRSRDQVAASTVCDDADIHGWHRPGDYMPRLIRALGAAVRAEPALNAWYDPATQARILFEHVDLAVAVDTPEGLIVPVLRDVHGKTLEALRASVADQKQAAHRRSSTPEDLAGFTLMLSNFGTLAGRYGIPLVVPPAVAILGAGKVRLEPVVVADAIVAHRRLPLSLSFDHRCVTGGEALRFLAAVIADLEQSDYRGE
jgi:pyruvate dehydrogenase E2 component (dihydrolipoamide acetyltransferase)